MKKKIIFSSASPGGLNAPFETRFGRCQTFTIVEQEDGKVIQVEVIQNPAAAAMGGAGIQAAQFVADQGATDIVVGFLGPNAAMGVAKNPNLKVYSMKTDRQYTVKEALDLFNSGVLSRIEQANVGSHHGMGGGMGGGGRGMGRGGGMGGGMGGGGRGMGRGGGMGGGRGGGRGRF